ncbi:MAG: hypothetical protein AAFP84_04720 [Actinomycetota bacterium]
MIRVLRLDPTTVTDSLRPPSPLDLLAPIHKDWLHLNVFVPDHDVSALINASVHGDPASPASLAVGATIVHDGRRDELFTAVQVVARHRAAETPTSVAVDPAASVSLHDDGWFACATGRAGDADVTVRATAAAEPIDAERPAPFGSGWISWRAMPRLRLHGEIRLPDRTVGLESAIGYQDHNWGRWRWGDDIGWRWGTFPTAGRDELAGSGAATVLTIADRTDRHHRVRSPLVDVQTGPLVRRFSGDTVRITYRGDLHDRRTPLVRLPGAVAALRSDRQRPDLPGSLVVDAVDGFDRATAEFEVERAVQLITSEPTTSGQTFIHELLGRFELSGTLAGRPIAGTGLGVFEHVD